MSSTSSGFALLEARTPTPIAMLDPNIQDQSTRAVTGEVTIVWPYNSITKTLAFLLAEPDVRLRRSKGQVRVQLRGSSAKAVSALKLGGGDTVALALEGVDWVKDSSSVRIPASRVEWQLVFTEKLVLQARVGEEQENKSVTIDNAQTTTPPPEMESQAAALLDHTEPTTTPARPQIASLTDSEPTEFASPAFLKRARISYGSLFEEGLDMFEEDGAVRGKGRKRTRFGRDSSSWRYTSHSPSPSPEAEPNTPVQTGEAAVEVQMEQDGSPIRPKMTDEGCQTMEFEMAPPQALPSQSERPPEQSLDQATSDNQQVSSPTRGQPKVPPLTAVQTEQDQATETLAAPKPVESHQQPQPATNPFASNQPAFGSTTLFGNFAPTQFSYDTPRFGIAAPLPIDGGLGIADQVRFGFSHIPQTTHQQAPDQPAPVSALGLHEPLHEKEPELHLQPAEPTKYADMKTYVDAAETERETDPPYPSSPPEVPPVVESFGEGQWDMATQEGGYNPVEGGHFGADALDEGTRIIIDEPKLQSDEIPVEEVPPGFDSYGGDEDEVSEQDLEVEEDDVNQEPVPGEHFVENEELEDDLDDEVAVEDEDEAKFNSEGDVVEEGDYDVRQYTAPEDDYEGLSIHDKEVEEEAYVRDNQPGAIDEEELYGEESGGEEEEGDFDSEGNDIGSDAEGNRLQHEEDVEDEEGNYDSAGNYIGSDSEGISLQYDDGEESVDQEENDDQDSYDEEEDDEEGESRISGVNQSFGSERVYGYGTQTWAPRGRQRNRTQTPPSRPQQPVIISLLSDSEDEPDEKPPPKPAQPATNRQQSQSTAPHANQSAIYQSLEIKEEERDYVLDSTLEDGPDLSGKHSGKAQEPSNSGTRNFAVWQPGPEDRKASEQPNDEPANQDFNMESVQNGDSHEPRSGPEGDGEADNIAVDSDDKRDVQKQISAIAGDDVPGMPDPVPEVGKEQHTEQAHEPGHESGLPDSAEGADPGTHGDEPSSPLAFTSSKLGVDSPELARSNGRGIPEQRTDRSADEDMTDDATRQQVSSPLRSVPDTDENDTAVTSAGMILSSDGAENPDEDVEMGDVDDIVPSEGLVEGPGNEDAGGVIEVEAEPRYPRLPASLEETGPVTRKRATQTTGIPQAGPSSPVTQSFRSVLPESSSPNREGNLGHLPTPMDTQPSMVFMSQQSMTTVFSSSQDEVVEEAITVTRLEVQVEQSSPIPTQEDDEAVETDVDMDGVASEVDDEVQLVGDSLVTDQFLDQAEDAPEEDEMELEAQTQNQLEVQIVQSTAEERLADVGIAEARNRPDLENDTGNVADAVANDAESMSVNEATQEEPMQEVEVQEELVPEDGLSGDVAEGEVMEVEEVDAEVEVNVDVETAAEVEEAAEQEEVIAEKEEPDVEGPTIKEDVPDAGESDAGAQGEVKHDDIAQSSDAEDTAELSVNEVADEPKSTVEVQIKSQRRSRRAPKQQEAQQATESEPKELSPVTSKPPKRSTAASKRSSAKSGRKTQEPAVDPSVELARASIQTRAGGGKKRPEPIPLSPRRTRHVSGSKQLSTSPQAEEVDSSVALAMAALDSPSKRGAEQTSSSGGSVQAHLAKRLRYTMNPPFSLLKSMRTHKKAHLSALVIATSNPTEPQRTKKREFVMSVSVTDASLAPDHVVEVQFSALHKAHLPVVKRGDGMSLISFEVVSMPGGKELGLRSIEDESAWTVFDDGDEDPVIKGAADKYTIEEAEMKYMIDLCSWYAGLDEASKEKLDKAGEKTAESSRG